MDAEQDGMERLLIDHEKAVWLGEMLRVGAVCLPTHRVGWPRSQIDPQQRDYILDREAVMDMLNRLKRISWHSVNVTNRSLALEILEQCEHSLRVMDDEMRRNEEKML